MNKPVWLWVAYTNTDRSEGRGREIPWAICLSETTALRMAKGIGGSVFKIMADELEDSYLILYSKSCIIKPSAGDVECDRIKIIEQGRKARLTVLLEKMNTVLNEEEMKFIKSELK